MCGLLGMISTRPIRLSDPACCRLRDLMTHRGPDGAGLWRGGVYREPSAEIVLGHRRLAVLDPTPAGQPPMATPDGRFVLVYNGELYNEPELRNRLVREGVPLSTGCDTETVLWWLATRGPGAVGDLRGMFALALVDRVEGCVVLARDPLGVKPLYWWQGRDSGADLLLFASEPGPILGHPAVTAEPDPVAVSAYLTTIRTVLGERTMFSGVRALPAGRVMRATIGGDKIGLRSHDVGIGTAELTHVRSERVALVREVVRGSVRAHLRSDVPTCCLLSGGLDSAIVTRVASESHRGLRTYCAGARDERAIDGVPQSDDFRFADEVARGLGTHHTEAVVDESSFLARWGEMVRRQGVPLSTPNEVAINEVARRLRADGCVVTLSGEGADELFGGYHRVLAPARAHIELGNHEPGLFHLAAGAWCGVADKSRVLTHEAWAEADGDTWLTDWFCEEFASVSHGHDPMADHLRFQRRVNLVGLLQRLDSATMLESVEGRTPFADPAVATLAESLPLEDRFISPDRTKIALREAFAADLPASVVGRAKASFPLPFQRWLGPTGEAVAGSAFVRSLVRQDVLDRVATDPNGLWNLAWPLANLSIWADRWWPERSTKAPSQVAWA
ncbi:MAG: asparagine synthase (glutamine-hydrolyzing) [Phycisphaerales bacterium JB041]